MPNDEEGPIRFNAAPPPKYVGSFIVAFLTMTGVPLGLAGQNFVKAQESLSVDNPLTQTFNDFSVLLVIIQLIFLFSCITLITLWVQSESQPRRFRRLYFGILTVSILSWAPFIIILYLFNPNLPNSRKILNFTS